MNWNKKLTVFVVLGLVLLGTLAMSGCTEDDSETTKVIITGSTTVKPIASRAASIFNDEHDDINVEVSGGGSGHGLASLGKGEADIGMASRGVKQSERDEYSDCDYTDHQIAKDGVAIIVSKTLHDAGVTELSSEDVYDIYTDEINNWKDVGGPDKNIFVVERQEGSGTRETFMDALGLDSVESDAAKPENAQVKSSVKSSDNAIGYVGLGYVGSDTPAVDLDGVEASEDTIKSGDYPISRSLHMYTDGEPEGAVKDFIDFVMSNEGQQIVADEDFIPVKGDFGDDDDDDDELSGTLTITGSTTVQPIAAKSASEFMDENPKVTVEVSGGGSGHGIASLGKGEADIGDASREIKQSEIDEYPDVDFYDNEIAKDGVAIIVSKDIYDAGVTDLTSDEVHDIYTKEITTWDEVGGPSKPIFVVERQEGSGTRETFMDALRLDSTNSDAAKPENAQVKSAVKTSDNAIGYVGLGYVGSETPAIKLNGVAPTEGNIVSGDYKISRSLHMYTDGEPTGLTKAFIDFILSEEGQQIVADEGFIPMNAGSSGGELSGTLTITGSTTVQPIAARAASAFMEKHPKVTVEVSGGGSGHGIASLGKGEADIGDASREIKQSEIDEYQDVDFYDNEIAKDGVAIIVSKDIYDAGVTDLSMDEIYDIYTKEITTWDEVGGPSKPIFVVERQEGSGTRETFMDAIGLDSTQADAAKPENAQVKSAVKTSNNGIGYVGLGYVGSDTPAIKLDGVKPTEGNIVSGDYKISRSLHMYTDGEPTGLTKAFIDFILSDEGQEIVAEEGFIPMNAGSRGGELSGTLTITGSTTVQPIAAAAASAFMEKHSDVTIQVSGGGSGHGIASLGKGEADIGDASREIKQSERDEYPDVDFYDNEIAKDGVAIIVSKDIYDAGVTDLSSSEVHDIYTGEINMWDEVGGPSKPIQVVERQEGSGTRETFMDSLGLESTDADVAKPENAQVKSAVKTSNNAIGYVGLGYVGEDTPAIKLNGVEPTEENIVSGDYKITRSLHMYTDGEPTGLTKAFIDFILSEEGQQIVAEEGFIPIKG